VIRVFTNGREFQKTSFKAISKTLTATQKNDLVNVLIDIKIKEIIDKIIGYNTTDFELVESITTASELLLERVKYIQNHSSRFDKLFPNASEIIQLLKDFTGKTNESNYIDKANSFLTQADQYKKTVKAIKEIEDFVEKKLPDAEKYSEFVKRVSQELDKMGGSYKEATMVTAIEDFGKHFESNLTNKYSEIEKLTQNIKDSYYVLLDKEHTIMVNSHLDLKKLTEDLINKIKAISVSANEDLLSEAEIILEYANKRICTRLELGYDTQCCTCSFTLYEMFSANEVVEQRRSKLFDIESRIRKELPQKDEKKEKQVHKTQLNITNRIMKVGDYKRILKEELAKVEKLDNYDSIELIIKTEGK
jgi:hypothetical protein